MSDRRALVTGGTRGIGLATALRLQEAGHCVWVTGRGTTPPPPGCELIAADLDDRAQVEALVSKISEMDFAVLVNNAGVNKIGDLERYAADDLQRLLRVNLEAPYRLCQAVLPAMRRVHFGRIVNISSVYGVVSRAGRSAYSSTKSGLQGMTRALALEVAADGVLVNCVAPGFVDTDLTRQVLGEAGMQELARSIPMRRLARPEEIAAVIHFLASAENSYLTGQTVVVDAGYTSE